MSNIDTSSGSSGAQPDLPHWVRAIIYIEDSDLVREMVTEEMQLWGFSVAAAESAEAAETHLADERIKLLISDVFLPGVSGVEFAWRFVASRGDRYALLSSGADFRYVGHALGPRIGVVAKPFSERELRDAIVNLLQAQD